MKILELTFFVENLCLYFERKIPSNETLEQWLPEVDHIPAEPLEWIAKQIKAGDTWPRNLPAAIKRGWSDWWEAHPKRRVQDRELGCDGCHLGYIYVSFFEEQLGGWYDITYRCAQCRPAYPRDMAMATVEQLASDGYCRPGSTVKYPYADCLPLPGIRPENVTRAVERGPVKRIVGDVADGMELPF